MYDVMNTTDIAVAFQIDTEAKRAQLDLTWFNSGTALDDFRKPLRTTIKVIGDLGVIFIMWRAMEESRTLIIDNDGVTIYLIMGLYEYELWWKKNNLIRKKKTEDDYYVDYIRI